MRRAPDQGRPDPLVPGYTTHLLVRSRLVFLRESETWIKRCTALRRAQRNYLHPVGRLTIQLELKCSTGRNLFSVGCVVVLRAMRTEMPGCHAFLSRALINPLPHAAEILNSNAILKEA